MATDRGLAADNDSNNVVVINQKSFDKVATLSPRGKGPDTVNYLEKEGKIYVSGTNDATEFDAVSPFKVAGNIRLSPDPTKDGPDIAVYVAKSDRVYQPIDNVIDVIDASSAKLLHVWRPGIKDAAKAAAYDEKTNHLIVGTAEKKLLVLDADSGAVVATIPVAGAVDATVIDEGVRRAYVGDKAGAVDIVDLDSNTIVGSLPSEKNMHTLAVDTRTHAIYVYRNESNKVDVFEMSAGS